MCPKFMKVIQISVKERKVFNYTHQHMHIYVYYLRSLKFTLKHLKRSYMFQSHNHPQGAYIVPC